MVRPASDMSASDGEADGETRLDVDDNPPQMRPPLRLRPASDGDVRLMMQ